MPSASSSQQPKNVATACVRCRESKVKCSGSNPCERCSTKNLSCTFSNTPDGRTQRQELKRKYECLEQEAATLRSIIDGIRDSREDDALKVFNLIKSGATYTEIHQCIQQHFNDDDSNGRERSPALQDLDTQITNIVSQQSSLVRRVEPIDSPTYKRTRDMARLIDNPPLKVPARPWTLVVDDDQLVSHLVSLWAVWHQWLGGLVVIEYFIRDMKTPPPDYRTSKFCSPFLVNCILTAGCYYSDYHETRARRGVVSRLCQQFMAEARRLWEDIRDEPPSLTTLQGLATLYTLIGMNNEDELCYQILVTVGHMGGKLGRKYLHTKPKSAEEEDFLRALSIACWGSFANSTASCRSLMKPACMEIPPLQLPPEQDSPDQKWLFYPREQTWFDDYTSELRLKVSELTKIDVHLTHVMYGDSGLAGKESEQPPADQVDQLLSAFGKLKLWHDGLPWYLRPHAKATPSILLLCAWYQGLLLNIGSLARKLKPMTSDPAISKLFDHDIDAAVATADICRIYQSSWSFKQIHVSFVWPVACALYRLTSELPFHRSETGHKYDADVTELCVFLRAAGRRIPFIVSVLRMYQLDVQQQGRLLPSSSEDLFVDFEANELAEFKAENVRSLFPSPAHVTWRPDSDSGYVQLDNMAEFLRKAENLSLQE